jgi:DNA primase
MAIPQGFIDELLSRVDLVEVIGRYVPLKRTGANFSGLCPFHSEKSPSFTVSPSTRAAASSRPCRTWPSNAA